MTPPTGPRVVVVTGASSGIGLATARVLAARGHPLVLAARRAAPLEALARDLDPGGTRVLAVPTDVTDDTSRRALVDAALARHGRIDVLVNNAGITVPRGWWWDDPDPLRVLRVNLDAPVELVRLVLPGMLARRAGHVVNVASVAGHVATNGLYSASKFGLRGFSLALRRELHGTGVHVSAVSPGFVRSEMTAGTALPMPGPDVVARAVADVLDRPRREVIVPRAYHVAVWLDRHAPALADTVIRHVLIRRRSGKIT